MTAALPMGGQKITGMADPTVTTDATTKSYVDALVASFFSTGDVKLTLKTVADTGWVMCNDSTIGSATSGASYQNANAQALFTLLFNNITDTFSPIYTSGAVPTTRAAQGSVGAAWAANCQISLTKVLGRALGIAGAGGAPLTARTLGQFLGEENHALTAAENGPHSHGGLTGNENANHTHQYLAGSNGVTYAPNAGASTGFAATPQNTSTESAAHQHVINSDGSGTAHNTMQPTSFLNAMIKL
jgi:microcystin-dependent protein